MKPTNKTAVPETATTPIVEMRNDQAVTTSLQIAECFNRPHKDVLQSIKKLDCSTIFQERNFSLSFTISELPNNGHKNLPMYYITRDGFTFLGMGFTGKVAAKFKESYIDAFNAMEQKLLEVRRASFANDPLVASIKPKTMYSLSDEYFNCIIDSVFKWIDCENRGSLSPDIRDGKLIKRFEAIRLIYFDSNHRKAPFGLGVTGF